MTERVAVIGTGTEPENPGRDGYAMAYHHASAFENVDDCELVACADIVRENAEIFAAEFDLPDDAIFADHRELLAAVEPDVVSICVPPAAHAEIAIDCARSPAVQAIHCEKPMADTFGDARRMAEAADRHDVQLTFNHQRRYGRPFRRAKGLLDDGEIGELTRLEFSAIGIYDYGSHSFDLCNYFNDERPASWVMAQVDYRRENRLFGAHNENQAIVCWEYDDGVHGFAGTANDMNGPAAAVGCHHRLVGTDGTIEVGAAEPGAPPLRIRRAGDADWERVDTDGEGLHDWTFVDRAVEDLIRCLREGERCELDAEHALRATALIFGAWESTRRRGRVDLPLAIEDNPLTAMVDAGELTPAPREDEEEGAR